MATTRHRCFWISLRHAVVLAILLCVGFVVYRFVSDPERMIESQVGRLGMHLSTWGKSQDDRFPTPSEKRRFILVEVGLVVGSGLAIGLITIGGIRVIKSWRKSLA
jgi:hypothetical protein